MVGYLFCFGSNFNEQAAQRIKDEKLDFIELPGMQHHAGDSQYGSPPADYSYQLTLQGAKLLIDTLSSCDFITTLYLCENYLTLEIVREIFSAISVHPGILRRLDLSGNKINSSWVPDIAQFVEANKPAPLEIVLSNNSLGNAGAEAIAQLIYTSPNLTSLNLNSNEIGPQGMAAVMGAVAATNSMVALSLERNVMGLQGHVACAYMLSANFSLKSFAIYSDEERERDTNATKSLLVAIGENNSLTDLHLFYIDPALEAKIAWDKEFYGIPFRTGELATAVHQHVLFNRLYNNFGIEVSQKQEIPLRDRWYRSPEPAELEQFGVFIFGGDHKFKEVPDTTKNLIRAIQVDSVRVERIVSYEASPVARNVTDVTMDQTRIVSFAMFLMSCANLVSVIVPGHNLSDNDIKKILGAIQVDCQMKLLDFRKNNITCEGARAIAKFMDNHKSLTSLNLQENKIELAGAQAIVAAALATGAVETLNLNENSSTISADFLEEFEHKRHIAVEEKKLQRIEIAKKQEIELIPIVETNKKEDDDKKRKDELKKTQEIKRAQEKERREVEKAKKFLIGENKPNSKTYVRRCLEQCGIV